MKFTDFNLKETIQAAITEAGFTEPSPVQKDAIPLILEGHDIIAQAQTGTGKTAAFGLPTMSMMKGDGSVEGLVIVPTRELAMQVSDELFRFGKLSGIKTATVYGGTAYGQQLERIKQASIVIATPGRLQDLLMSGKVKMSPKFVILDEADEMLDMGFLDEIKNIFTFLPKERQTLMFSATMPNAIRKLAEEILNDPKTVSITKSEKTNTKITQFYYVVQEKERDDALVRLIDYKNPDKCIIFCRMKKEVDRLVAHMTAQGFKVSGLHGDMEQKQREVTIRAFKSGGIDIFIATDVAARGLDVNDVTHVFNYHIPFDSESYVHRIGRTGRGGKTGEAITLVTPNELKTIKRIEKDVGTTMTTQVIPTRMEVQNNRSDALIAKIAETKVTENAINLVKTLQHDLDIVTIAHLLASLVQEENFVQGKDNIGLGLEEIELLIQRAMNSRSGGSGDRSGNRNRSGGGGGYRGNKPRTGGAGGGSSDRHGRNGRSSGGRDSRNGGQGSRG
ncbi:MAG TPA: DEAD/DEAH box helicase [Sulfurovum sp.]|nr:MAG: DEAD/DEAH box helicase [Sulfurovum sp. 35-42-20]OYY55702.1 MAG: DEAD/DEAH box helicase [Sulfurovum sp. 28-43-6]OYZ25177.1 MAG: DEAD/DEAH box helicase [Sulfurovum sp. 16-42-52]OYZ48615.1 MAG: DEAD/DEAH box helicase [Sulfurovum sp. 24-42-9]OZA45335.1 MAG: DEAD/DEAH box helicase [Sulfurovum sp. 17-42-90]OZA61022.1 MAG: DEAD/DEAH box helicase [Sulfurovum sp. 39-42-12]HQR74386.1 DEAD/DEAH box helicase [Sulfurovum sp.]